MLSCSQPGRAEPCSGFAPAVPLPLLPEAGTQPPDHSPHSGAAVTVPRAQHSPLEISCSQTQFRQGTHQSGAAARAGETTCPAPPACNTRSRRWREGPGPRGCWKVAELLWPLEYNHTGFVNTEHHSNFATALLELKKKSNAKAGVGAMHRSKKHFLTHTHTDTPPQKYYISLNKITMLLY